ncbi:MAG: hypothetical protein VB878_21355 [Pirellulaceae bacterium]
MKSKHELTELIKEIASDTSPVGMDAVYVHALILDKLTRIERRLDQIEAGTAGSDAGKETDN